MLIENNMASKVTLAFEFDMSLRPTYGLILLLCAEYMIIRLYSIHVYDKALAMEADEYVAHSILVVELTT